MLFLFGSSFFLRLCYLLLSVCGNIRNRSKLFCPFVLLGGMFGLFGLILSVLLFLLTLFLLFTEGFLFDFLQFELYIFVLLPVQLSFLLCKVLCLSKGLCNRS